MKDELINSILMMLDEAGFDIAGIKEKLYLLMKDMQITQLETTLAVRDDAVNEQFLKRFIAAKMVKGCTKNTIRMYGKEIGKILRKFSKSCTEITTDDIRVYIAYRIAQDGISKVTANNELRFLRTFFGWLSDECLIPKNPMTRVEVIKEDKKKKPAFSDIECEKIRSACRTEMETAIIEVLLSTGCRVSELCKMRIDEMHNGEIIVHGKGNKDRIVYLNARAEIALQKYLGTRKDTNPYIFPPGMNATGKSGANHNKLWYTDPKAIGDGIRDKSGIEQTVRRIGKIANVDDVHPHRFRRTCATFALRRGMPIELVSKMLGHSQITTTQIYLDLSDAELEAAHRKYVV